MFFCTYSVSARIFCNGSETPEVSSAAFCLICEEAIRLDWVSPPYQIPMSRHDPDDFARSLGSLGKYLTPAQPATVRHEGMPASTSTAARSCNSHVYWLAVF